MITHCGLREVPTVVSSIEGVNTLYDSTVSTYSEYKPLDPFFTFAGIYNTVDEHFYFGVMSKGGSPHNRSHYVFKYDPATNTIVEKIHVPKATGTSVFDVHVDPVVMTDASGDVYLIVERSGNSTGWSDNHNSDVLIYKTSTPGDLSTMALWKTLAGKYSYPKVWINGANYYMIARGQRVTVDIGKTTLEKSTDSGANWTAITVINLPIGTPVRRVYSQIIHSDDTTLYLACNIRNDTEGSFESTCVIKSSDGGVTWSNFQGTFSKDVVTNGALSESELTTNCMIWSTATPDTEMITFEGGYVKNGVIKILLGRQTLTGVVVEGNGEGEYSELRLYTYSGGWTYADVSSLIPADFQHFWAYERILQYVPTSSGDCIYVLDRRDTDAVTFTEYTSSNFFTSNTSRLVWSGAGNYYYGSHARNAEVKKLFVLFNTIGTYNDTADWSYLRIINTEA